MAKAKDPPTGYSGTPLWKKLGIKPGATVTMVRAPRGYRAVLAGVPDGVTFTTKIEAPVEFSHVFVRTEAELALYVFAFRDALAPDGVLWVSWPKKASGVETDVTEDRIRDVALPMGLVDVKVCAVDATWSAIKLVLRVANRPK